MLCTCVRCALNWLYGHNLAQMWMECFGKPIIFQFQSPRGRTKPKCIQNILSKGENQWITKAVQIKIEFLLGGNQLYEKMKVKFQNIVWPWVQLDLFFNNYLFKSIICV